MHIIVNANRVFGILRDLPLCTNWVCCNCRVLLFGKHYVIADEIIIIVFLSILFDYKYKAIHQSWCRVHVHECD